MRARSAGRLMLVTALLAAVLTPPTVAGAAGPAAVALGADHSCALVSGLLQCWGSNGAGELGDGNPSPNRTSPVLVDASGALHGVAVAQLAAGVSHSCARSTAGVVYCWGANSDGQLGDGTTTDRLAPTPVNLTGPLAGTQFTELSIGHRHTCALASTGTVYCWGFNGYGQLGDGTTASRSAPTPASAGAVSFAHLGVGVRHTCAISAAGTAYCWGENAFGQLGDGSTTTRSTPTAVSTTTALNGVSLALIDGNVRHTCAVSLAGVGYCWGANGVGQVGDGTTTNRTRAVAVTTAGALNGVTLAEIATGYRHTCARSTTGTAYCWGLNDVGQLGDGTMTNRAAPVVAGTGSAILADLDIGDSQTCAGTATGGVFCWGDNDHGQIGDGTLLDRSNPTAVTLAAAPTPTAPVPAAPGGRTLPDTGPPLIAVLAAGVGLIAASTVLLVAMSWTAGVRRTRRRRRPRPESRQ